MITKAKKQKMVNYSNLAYLIQESVNKSKEK
jgi:hypothetical protein